MKVETVAVAVPSGFVEGLDRECCEPSHRSHIFPHTLSGTWRHFMRTGGKTQGTSIRSLDMVMD